MTNGGSGTSGAGVADTSAAAAPVKASRGQRSKSDEATIVRAKAVAKALPTMLDGIAQADSHASKVRIDEDWLTQFGSLIESAEQAADGLTVRVGALAGATSAERAVAATLVGKLVSLRDRIATHFQDDAALQKLFLRGASLHAGSTGSAIAAAGSVALAFAGPRHDDAVAAGVTQADVDEISALRAELSSADVAQHGVIETNKDGTVDRRALMSLVATRTAYAVKVVQSVFGKGSKEAAAVADTRPVVGATKTRKSNRDAVAKRRKVIAAALTAPAKKATKKKPAKKAAKKAAPKRKPAKKPAKKATKKKSKRR